MRRTQAVSDCLWSRGRSAICGRSLTTTVCGRWLRQVFRCVIQRLGNSRNVLQLLAESIGLALRGIKQLLIFRTDSAGTVLQFIDGRFQTRDVFGQSGQALYERVRAITNGGKGRPNEGGIITDF